MTTREGYHRFQGGWQPSAAQRRVLDSIAAGRTNVELATELGLSPETVKWHVSQLLAQTGCADRLPASGSCRSIEDGSQYTRNATALTPKAQCDTPTF